MSQGMKKIKSTSAYKDLLTSMTNVGCLSPMNNTFEPGAPDGRSTLAVALFGCSSHQQPINIDTDPPLTTNMGSEDHETNQNLLGAFFKQKVEMSRVLEVRSGISEGWREERTAWGAKRRADMHARTWIYDVQRRLAVAFSSLTTPF